MRHPTLKGGIASGTSSNNRPATAGSRKEPPDANFKDIVQQSKLLLFDLKLLEEKKESEIEKLADVSDGEGDEEGDEGQDVQGKETILKLDGGAEVMSFDNNPEHDRVQVMNFDHVDGDDGQGTILGDENEADARKTVKSNLKTIKE